MSRPSGSPTCHRNARSTEDALREPPETARERRLEELAPRRRAKSAAERAVDGFGARRIGCIPRRREAARSAVSECLAGAASGSRCTPSALLRLHRELGVFTRTRVRGLWSLPLSSRRSSPLYRFGVFRAHPRPVEKVLPARGSPALRAVDRAGQVLESIDRAGQVLAPPRRAGQVLEAVDRAGQVLESIERTG